MFPDPAKAQPAFTESVLDLIAKHNPVDYARDQRKYRDGAIPQDVLLRAFVRTIYSMIDTSY